MAKEPKARRGPGQPEHRPTIANRQTVEEMKFCGESEDVIARALGISTPTLRKHYAVELTDGHANRRQEVISLLFTAARKGNVSAAKRLDEMGRVAGAAAAVKAREPAAPRLGKKEQQQEAAIQVGGKFATPSGPKLVVNNK
jgi:hypothetical protein